MFVDLKTKKDEQQEETCCDGTGWTGNVYERCAEHYEPINAVYYGY